MKPILAVLMLPGALLSVMLSRIIPGYGRCKPLIAATVVLTGPAMIVGFILIVKATTP